MAKGDDPRMPRVCEEPDTFTRQHRRCQNGLLAPGLGKLRSCLKYLSTGNQEGNKKKSEIKCKVLSLWKHLTSSSLEKVIQFICLTFASSDLAKITVIIETSSTMYSSGKLVGTYFEPNPDLGTRNKTEKKVEMEPIPLELTVLSRVILAMLC